MNARRGWLGFVLAACAAAAGYGLYELGMRRGLGMAVDSGVVASHAAAETHGGPPSAAAGEEATRRHLQAGLRAGDIDPVNGRKILYYHDPMVPASRFDKPGKSPFMDMMLSPVYADAGGSDAGISISPRTQQSLGVRTAEVVSGTLSSRVSAVGSIAFNERDQAIVQARAAAFVERLHTRATLDRVAKGQPLVDLYVPEWIAAQEEFLSLRRMQGTDLAALVDAARQRMRLVGMDDKQIQLVERTGKTQPRLALTAPISGVLVEVAVREGMTVAPGATLFRISGLGTVWANAEVPESQAARLHPGADVKATTPALPGTTFAGTVQSILPDVSAATRTIKARVELANPGARLVPGMFVQMQFIDDSLAKGLLVPSDAIIQTGRRTVAIVAEGDGHFRSVDVEIGSESGGRTEVRNGLSAGQRVVISSQFLIDSEASLRGLESRLNGAPAGSQEAGSPAAGASAPAAAAQVHVGEGKVERIGGDGMTLSHGPIASIQWSAMTMEFKLPAAGAPPGVRRGDRVRFSFVVGADGVPQLTSVSPAAAGAAAASSGARP